MPSAMSGLLLIYNMDQEIKDRENVVDQSKYVYHNEIYMWRPSEGGIWPIKAQNPLMNATCRLPSTKTNINAKGDPLRCFSSHQMDQRVLDIQRNVLFL